MMTMKFRGISLLAIVMMIMLFTSSLIAQTVDEEIRSLKEKLAALEAQQLDLKKEATAAAQAMPTFSYRPGNGLNIQAADKAWGLRFSLETHFRMLFESGRDQIGRTNGEIMGRRFRPEFWYCLNNCLWEIEAALDLDGFGTGNAKNSTGTTVGPILQRGAVWLHLENVNPWLPTVHFGMETQNAHGGVWPGRVRERPAPRQSTICTPKTTGLTQVGLARALPSTGTTDHSPASVFRAGSVVSSSPWVASAEVTMVWAVLPTA